jgi:hypothetical protein
MHDKTTQRAMDAAEKLRVKSALNPALWMCAIVSVPLIIAMLLLNENPPLWLIIIVTSPVIMTVAGFIFLLVFDRDKLQSEDYQLRKQSLELIQEKGQDFPINATSIEVISNPSKAALLENEGEDK